MDCLFGFEQFQAGEDEADPLVTVEKGSAVVTDAVGPRDPGWKSNKDLHAWFQFLLVQPYESRNIELLEKLLW